MPIIRVMHEKMADVEVLWPVINVPFSAMHVLISLPQSLMSTLLAIMAEAGYKASEAGEKASQNNWLAHSFAWLKTSCQTAKADLWEDARLGAIHTIGSSCNAISLGLLYAVTPAGRAMSSAA